MRLMRRSPTRKERPGDTVLTAEAIEEGNVRLACVSVPTTELVKVVYNTKADELLEDLLLPPEPYRTTA